MFPSVHIRKGVKDRTFNMNTEIADLFGIAQKKMISEIVISILCAHSAGLNM